ncbi:hypothetical protein ABT144_14460 [Streptomyces sp. NPDC002039]|uniref:hypothetical protein n=1 Tax=Streptomyces sp. NPDC002039 TaxID=3154660 RepID=UPI00331A6029
MAAFAAGSTVFTFLVLPVAFAAKGVAALRGADTEAAYDMVANPGLEGLEQAIKAGDKYNETVVKAAITAAVGKVAKNHGTQK